MKVFPWVPYAGAILAGVLLSGSPVSAGEPNFMLEMRRALYEKGQPLYQEQKALYQRISTLQRQISDIDVPEALKALEEDYARNKGIALEDFLRRRSAQDYMKNVLTIGPLLRESAHLEQRLQEIDYKKHFLFSEGYRLLLRADMNDDHQLDVRELNSLAGALRRALDVITAHKTDQDFVRWLLLEGADKPGVPYLDFRLIWDARKIFDADRVPFSPQDSINLRTYLEALRAGQPLPPVQLPDSSSHKQ